MRTCGSVLLSQAIGMRLYSTSEGSFFLHAARYGSNEAQCGQEYWKNSSTSILPPDSTGTGVLSTV